MIFFDKYCIGIIIAFIITSTITILVIIKEGANLARYRNEMISSRDDDFCKLLDEKGINSTNIKDVIDYFVLELEPVSIVYKESPMLNSILKFGSNLFFLLLGIIIPSIIKEKVNQDRIQTYAIITTILIIIGFIIDTIKIYTYFFRKDTYLSTTQKLVIDLKQIDLLDKLK